ncbi:AAA-like domain-containing protein [Anaerolineales bacterium HSG6]|nr:AAA-like domain-containing protein [Anaerolineales bacterium HSG6]
MSEQLGFFTGGTIPPGEGIYINRQADVDLLACCREGKFAYVLASRQSGKSSLVVATMEKLREEQITPVSFDVTDFGETDITVDNWYYSLICELMEELELDFPVTTWWDERGNLLSSIRFRNFLRDVVLPQIQTPIVIFIDEIDATQKFKFRDDFFKLLRSFYNARAKDDLYKRLTVVLIGTATPDELISDQNQTPFNVAQGIKMADFKPQECKLFQQALEAKHPHQGQAYFERIYYWTNGHPFITHQLSQMVAESVENGGQLVDDLVDRLYLTNASEDNIKSMERTILHNDSAQDMLTIYQQVLEEPDTVDDNKASVAIRKLKLYGLVVSHRGKLRVRNRIYERVFNLEWVMDKFQGVHREVVELKAVLVEKDFEIQRLQTDHEQMATKLQQQLVSYKEQITGLTENKTRLQRQTTSERQEAQQRSKTQAKKYEASLWWIVILFTFIVFGSVGLAYTTHFEQVTWQVGSIALMVIAWGMAFGFVFRFVSQLNSDDTTPPQPDSTTMPLSPSERVSLDR